MDTALFMVGLTLVYGLGVVVGYRHGRTTERNSAILQRRLRELDFYGPMTYQNTGTDGPPVEHD